MRATTPAVLVLVLTTLGTAHALERPASPAADVKGARDNPLLGRYEGSFIVEQTTRAFDAVSLPAGALAETDRRDQRNNLVYAPRERKDVEGRVTRTLYVLPPDRSTLEVLRNYQEEVAAKGGEILYECAGEACGGDTERGIDAGGSTTGLLVWLYPLEQLKAPAYSNAYCALAGADHAEQRYAAARLPSPGGGGEAQVGIMTYALKDSTYCGALTGRVVALTTIVEPKAREQRMVTLSSAEMRQGIASQGHVALYGINFDFDKADIRPDSRPQLDQIGELLKADPAAKLFVVGHTDDKGAPAYNLELSRRRAEAVVATLVKDYRIDKARLAAHGVGQLAPLAPNATDEGRARNRRVELVSR